MTTNAMWAVKFKVADQHSDKACRLRNVRIGLDGFSVMMMCPDAATPTKAARHVRDTLKERLHKYGVPARAITVTSIRCVG